MPRSRRSPALARARRAVRTLLRWPAYRSGRGAARATVVAELGRCLGDRPGAAVAVLCGPAERAELAAMVRAVAPGTRVVPVDVTCTASELHVALAAAGPFAAVLAGAEPSGRPAPVATFRRTFFHLEPGGVYLCWATRPAAAPQVQRLARYLARLQRRAGVPARPLRGRRRDRARLAEAVGRTRLDRDVVLVTNQVNALAKIREEELAPLLAAQPPRFATVLQEHGPTELTPRAPVTTSRPDRPPRLPRSYRVPAVCVRAYDDVLVRPGQVAVWGHLLLPDTYRRNQRARLTNHHTRELARRFATLPDRGAVAAPLPGAYFYLDDEWPAHFGHTMTEVTSRLWGWEVARSRYPDLKVLMSLRSGAGELPGFQVEILRAWGVAPDEVVAISAPARVATLVGATPMFSQPHYVHPALAPVWRRLGDRLEAAAPARSRPSRIFCARRQAKRRCRNAEEVEALFGSYGFTVVHPEDHPLPEQVAMFRQAEVVAGYAGSGMFTLAMCDVPTEVLLVSSQTYTARNEHLISGLLGHRLHVLWCRSDPAAGPGARFNADFTFDLAREGAYLQRVLAGR